MTGLIPAHAGKTYPSSRRAYLPRAHPRSRGENVQGYLASHFLIGSSPLTRGKPPRGPPREVGAGLIPAHAGKTPACDAVHTLPRAHPRSRGENPKTRSEPHLGPGSSPLTRGKPSQLQDSAPTRGLIPAHAGKTQGGDPAVGRTGAHPRSRGENRRQARRRQGRDGSSPLTRGKHGGDRRRRARSRLIPAHAGKTCRTPP